MEERLEWAKHELQRQANLDRFRVFFAVHELEAWLLSDPDLFPRSIKQALPGSAQHPESVNFDEPPSKLLERLYRGRLRRSYKKVTDGGSLFDRLDPDTVYSKCPHFGEMMDEMLTLARSAGS